VSAAEQALQLLVEPQPPPADLHTQLEHLFLQQQLEALSALTCAVRRSSDLDRLRALLLVRGCARAVGGCGPLGMRFPLLDDLKTKHWGSDLITAHHTTLLRALTLYTPTHLTLPHAPGRARPAGTLHGHRRDRLAATQHTTPQRPPITSSSSSGCSSTSRSGSPAAASGQSPWAPLWSS